MLEAKKPRIRLTKTNGVSKILTKIRTSQF
jgi:hypothetical protein